MARVEIFSFLKFLIVFSFIQAIDVASTRTDHEPKIWSNGPQYNDMRKLVEYYETQVAENLHSVVDFLGKALDVRTTNYCNKFIQPVLNSTPWVESLVLDKSYESAINHLVQAANILSNCSELHVPDSVTIPEAVLDYTNQAFIRIKKSTTMVKDLQQLQIEYTDTLLDPQEGHAEAEMERGGCKLDGTKCQFSKCGAGKRLRFCAAGFASGVIGGAYGRIYTVTSSDDSNPENPRPGTLRYAVNLVSKAQNPSQGIWITFSTSMTITLSEMLWLGSFTTIDGRGVDVIITGKNIVLSGVRDVILHNFQVENIGTSDTVHIFYGTRKVWVDHLTSTGGKLGLISVIQGSTDVTISNCFLSDFNFNMLLGASDFDTIDRKLRVTVYRNWFKDSKQRMPHCRWGYCHVVNNLYSNWGYYAIGARAHAKICSEKNVFKAGAKKEITPWDEGHGSDIDKTATIQSRGDLFLNGATFHEFLSFGKLADPPYIQPGSYPPILSTSVLSNIVEHCAGALSGPKVIACMESR